ncbi:MAG: ferrous iron transport protein A [Phycisphaerales bacterium]|nr:ferrous iron transport protein A [Phycisphaerales bacterium]
MTAMPGTMLVTRTIPLPELAIKACATVSRIEAADADTDRLKAMGVCIGRKVELVQAGDPLILRVLGHVGGVSPVGTASVCRCLYRPGMPTCG